MTVVLLFNFKGGSYMAQFTVAQERQAACIVCPQKYKTNKYCCKRERCSCSIHYQDDLRRSKKFRKEILSICHFLHDDTLKYFKIKD